MEELVNFSGEDQPCICMMRRELDWLVESEATHHATLRKDVFVTYSSGDFGAVKIENKDVLEIGGIGDIHFETKTSWPLALKDVRHVPDLLLNLISASMLDDSSYNVNLGAKS